MKSIVLLWQRGFFYSSPNFTSSFASHHSFSIPTLSFTPCPVPPSLETPHVALDSYSLATLVSSAWNASFSFWPWIDVASTSASRHPPCLSIPSVHRPALPWSLPRCSSPNFSHYFSVCGNHFFSWWHVQFSGIILISSFESPPKCKFLETGCIPSISTVTYRREVGKVCLPK